MFSSEEKKLILDKEFFVAKKNITQKIYSEFRVEARGELPVQGAGGPAVTEQHAVHGLGVVVRADL